MNIAQQLPAVLMIDGQPRAAFSDQTAALRFAIEAAMAGIVVTVATTAALNQRELWMRLRFRAYFDGRLVAAGAFKKEMLAGVPKNAAARFEIRDEFAVRN